MNDKELSRLIILESPEAVISEVKLLLQEISPQISTAEIERDFWTAVQLYRGEYPGYRSCTTEYHNLFHALQTFLAMGRLFHGASCINKQLPPEIVLLGMTAAIFHDAGYLQAEGDNVGTGAKYTLSHVSRSIALMRQVCMQFGYREDQVLSMEAMILTTDLARDWSTISYPTHDVEVAARLLDTADLIAQMSDRAYLEKLLFLFHEFREAGIRNYESEVDLLEKTIGFYDLVKKRLQPTFELADSALRAHYLRRNNIDCNPYLESIRRQRSYLKQVLEETRINPKIHLRRDGIVEKVKNIYIGNG